MIKMYTGIHIMCSLLLLDINETIFFDRFFKNAQVLDFMKLHPVGVELFHAGRQTDRQTDRDGQARSCFSQFCKRK